MIWSLSRYVSNSAYQITFKKSWITFHKWFQSDSNHFLWNFFLSFIFFFLFPLLLPLLPFFAAMRRNRSPPSDDEADGTWTPSPSPLPLQHLLHHLHPNPWRDLCHLFSLLYFNLLSLHITLRRLQSPWLLTLDSSWSLLLETCDLLLDLLQLFFLLKSEFPTRSRPFSSTDLFSWSQSLFFHFSYLL